MVVRSVKRPTAVPDSQLVTPGPPAVAGVATKTQCAWPRTGRQFRSPPRLINRAGEREVFHGGAAVILREVSPPEPGTPRATRWPGLLILSAALLATCWFHVATFFTRWTDENVHLYVAQRVLEGARLYAAIPSARPPLALLPLVAGLGLGLPPLLVARLAVVLCLVLTAATLWWAGRRQWAGLAAAALFLLLPEAFARGAYTGIHWVALGCLCCVVLTLRGRLFAAGLAGGLALAAGQHAAVLVAGAGLISLVRSRAQVLRFAGGLGVGLGVPLAVVAVAAGPAAVWQDLVARHLYHLGHAAPSAEGDLSFFLLSTAFENLPWLGLAVLGAVWPQGNVEVRRARALVGLLVVAHLGVVASMTGGLVLYLFPAMPLLALLAGHGLVAVLRPGPGRWALVVVAALLGGGWFLAQARYEARDHRGYAFVPMLRQVEMSRLQRLVVAERVVAALEPVLHEGDTLFGAPPLVTAVAGAMHHRVAGDLADLAPRWLQLGLVSRKTVIETIEADRVRAFVVDHGVYEHDPVFTEYLSRCYGPPRFFEREAGDGAGVPRVSVYLHLEGPCLASASSPAPPRR